MRSNIFVNKFFFRLMLTETDQIFYMIYKPLEFLNSIDQIMQYNQYRFRKSEITEKCVKLANV